MNERGKSDWPVVPEKPVNNDGGAPLSAESVEGRGQAKGNPVKRNSLRTQHRDRLSQVLGRIRQAYWREGEQRWCHRPLVLSQFR